MIYFVLVGDVFYVNWDEVLAGATAVVSTLGGFGSDEQMQRINGEANVVAVNAAKEYGEELFVIILLLNFPIICTLLFIHICYVVYRIVSSREMSKTCLFEKY